MQDRIDRLRQRAPVHANAASEYLADAQDLFQRNRPASGACLLYEAAKSSINAIANLRGENPGPTDRKAEALRQIAEGYSDPERLRAGWEGARKLHIHCDQFFLNDADFDTARLAAILFIHDMLALFRQQAQG